MVQRKIEGRTIYEKSSSRKSGCERSCVPEWTSKPLKPAGHSEYKGHLLLLRTELQPRSSTSIRRGISTCRLLHVFGREFDTGALRLGANLVADLLLGLGPLAVERGERFVALDELRLLPRGAARSSRRRRRRPSGCRRRPATRHRPISGRPRSARRGLRCRGRCCRRERRSVRKPRSRPGETCAASCSGAAAPIIRPVRPRICPVPAGERLVTYLRSADGN